MYLTTLPYLTYRGGHSVGGRGRGSEFYMAKTERNNLPCQPRLARRSPFPADKGGWGREKKTEKAQPPRSPIYAKLLNLLNPGSLTLLLSLVSSY